MMQDTADSTLLPPSPPLTFEELRRKYENLIAAAEAETDEQRRTELADRAYRYLPLTPRTPFVVQYHEAVEQEDWVTAEYACRRLLEFVDFPMQKSWDWQNLAAVLAKQNRHQEAFEAAKHASVLDDSTGALYTESHYAMMVGELDHARACLDEAIGIAEQFKELDHWKETYQKLIEAREKLK